MNTTAAHIPDSAHSPLLLRKFCSDILPLHAPPNYPTDQDSCTRQGVSLLTLSLTCEPDLHTGAEAIPGCARDISPQFHTSSFDPGVSQP